MKNTDSSTIIITYAISVPNRLKKEQTHCRSKVLISNKIELERPASWPLWDDQRSGEWYFSSVPGKKGDALYGILYFLILAQRVLRSMPSSSAARVLLPYCVRRTDLMYSFSISSRVLYFPPIGPRIAELALMP
jgi:hypothetical protein